MIISATGNVSFFFFSFLFFYLATVFRLQVLRETLRKFHANVPQSATELSDQAKIDIPSIIRGEMWSGTSIHFMYAFLFYSLLLLALLGIRGTDYISEYHSIDVMRIGPSDKQIMLDIPRCHQYHPLLASPVGHKKFKRVLKAWVAVCLFCCH